MPTVTVKGLMLCSVVCARHTTKGNEIAGLTQLIEERKSGYYWISVVSKELIIGFSVLWIVTSGGSQTNQRSSQVVICSHSRLLCVLSFSLIACFEAFEKGLLTSFYELLV